MEQLLRKPKQPAHRPKTPPLSQQRSLRTRFCIKEEEEYEEEKEEEKHAWNRRKTKEMKPEEKQLNYLAEAEFGMFICAGGHPVRMFWGPVTVVCNVEDSKTSQVIGDFQEKWRNKRKKEFNLNKKIKQNKQKRSDLSPGLESNSIHFLKWRSLSFDDVIRSSRHWI